MLLIIDYWLSVTNNRLLTDNSLNVCFLLSENPLQFLEQLPQFQNLRREIQNNHALLPLLLQQIGQSNPQLLQVSYEGYS